MRIGIKLGLAFGFLLFLASALGGMDYRAMSRSAANSTIIAREFLPMNSLGAALTQDLSTISLDMRVFSFTGDPKMFDSAHAAILQAEKRIADLTPTARTFKNVPKLEDVLENAPKLMEQYRASMVSTKELSDTVANAIVRMDATAVDVEKALVELQNSISAFLRDSITTGSQDAVERRYSNLSLVNGIMVRIQNVRLLMLKATFSKDLGVFDEIAKLSVENDKAFAILDKQLSTPQNRQNLTRVMDCLQRYRVEMGVVRQAWQKNVELGKDRLKLGYSMQAIIGDITRSSMAASTSSALVTAEENSNAVSVMLIMLGLVLLIGIVVSVVLTRMITGPIRKNVAFAQAVANGNLNEQLDVRGTDEIGQLSDALRWMVDALKNRISEATEQSEQARIKGEEANAAMETARVAQHEAENAKRVGMLTAAERLEGVVAVLSSASEELRAQLSHAGHGTEEQAARVAETATAMQQMNATVLEVARNAGAASDVTMQTRQRAEEGAKIVQQALQSISSVQEQSLSLKKDMAELGEHTRSISQIMGVISDIADQTNLLALNAAIEAARAGEAGRGFAVVADEVRKLAEKTMASTTDVSNAIRAIQQSAEKNMAQVDVTVARIEEATALASKSGDTLGDIVRMVDNAADQVRAIATASEEQSASSEQINQAITQINHITASTAETMRESTDAVQNLAKQAHELSGLIIEMKRN